jgi:hypothetical protein
VLHRFSGSSRGYRVVVNEPSDDAELVIRSPRDAASFLRHESHSPGDMRGLRRVLAGTRSGIDVGHLSEEDVLLHLGWLVAQRRVRLHRARRVDLTFPPDASKEDEDSALGPLEGFGVVADLVIQGPPLFDVDLVSKDPPLCEVELSLDPVPGAESDADALDATAQAETLREAAAAGVPFCEECEKARLEAEAEQSDERVDASVAGIDPAAQAATMQSAAADGTPFCEECEKATRDDAAAAA